MPQSVDTALSSEDTAPHASAQTCVIQTSEEDGRGEQDKREKQGEADVGKGAPGPGQLLGGGPALPTLPGWACGLTPGTPSVAVTATAGVRGLPWVPGAPQAG